MLSVRLSFCLSLSPFFFYSYSLSLCLSFFLFSRTFCPAPFLCSEWPVVLSVGLKTLFISYIGLPPSPLSLFPHLLSPCLSSLSFSLFLFPHLLCLPYPIYLFPLSTSLSSLPPLSVPLSPRFLHVSLPECIGGYAHPVCTYTHVWGLMVQSFSVTLCLISWGQCLTECKVVTGIWLLPGQ